MFVVCMHLCLYILPGTIAHSHTKQTTTLYLIFSSGSSQENPASFFIAALHVNGLNLPVLGLGRSYICVCVYVKQTYQPQNERKIV